MRKRDVQINFRLTQDEAKELEKKIQKSGLRKELFMRMLISGCKFTEKPDKEFYQIMRELTGIVNALNQLTAKYLRWGLLMQRRLRVRREIGQGFTVRCRRDFYDNKIHTVENLLLMFTGLITSL